MNETEAGKTEPKWLLFLDRHAARIVNFGGAITVIWALVSFLIHTFYWFLFCPIILLPIAVALMTRRINGRIKWTALAFCFSVGTSFLLIYFRPKPSPEPSPSLIAKLVVDSVSISNVSFHYEVSNIGQGIARRVFFRDASQGNIQQTFEPPPEWTNTEISPQQTQRISLAPGTWGQNGESFFSRVLTLSWQGSGTNQFRRAFRFYGGTGSLRTGAEFYPEAANNGATVRDSRMELAAGFTNPIGRIAAVFFETNATGQEVPMTFWDIKKALDIDVKKRLATFSIIDDRDQTRTIRLEIVPNPKRMHLFIASWNSNGCSLVIDSQRTNTEGFSSH